MRIAINPGHHLPEDPGAVNQQNGLQEADVCFDIALRLQRLLAYMDYETHFISSNELYEITDLANAAEADIFVSIHANAAENTDARGTETFCYYGSSAGRHLADFIHAEMVGLGLADRGVKEAGFYVIKNTNMPGVLVETAFISNSADAEFLASEDGRQRIAEAIYRGIQNYGGAV